MPSVTDGRAPVPSDHGSGLFKKRRRDEYASELTATATIAPLPHSHGDVVTIVVHGRATAAASAASTVSGEHAARTIMPLAKRFRFDDSENYKPPTMPETSPQQTSISSTPTTPTITTFALTAAPCHICHRRPRKCDLASLADCTGCGGRTCFVCLRECLGWHLQRPTADQRHGHDTPTDGSKTPIEDAIHEDVPAPFQPEDDEDELCQKLNNTHHRQHQPWSASPGGRGHRHMVCSRCCVERGEDGDVMCLGCLELVSGP